MNYPQNIKSQIVELVVPASSTLTRFQFTTQNFLRQKQVVSLETFSINDLLLSPQGYALPTKANLQSAYVTFYGSDPEKPDANGDWLQTIPLLSMHRMVNGTDPYVFDLYRLVPRSIVWEKSFIQLGAQLGSGSIVSFVFNVGYVGTVGD